MCVEPVATRPDTSCTEALENAYTYNLNMLFTSTVNRHATLFSRSVWVCRDISKSSRTSTTISNPSRGLLLLIADFSLCPPDDLEIVVQILARACCRLPLARVRLVTPTNPCWLKLCSMKACWASQGFASNFARTLAARPAARLSLLATAPAVAGLRCAPPGH